MDYQWNIICLTQRNFQVLTKGFVGFFPRHSSQSQAATEAAFSPAAFCGWFDVWNLSNPEHDDVLMWRLGSGNKWKKLKQHPQELKPRGSPNQTFMPKYMQLTLTKKTCSLQLGVWLTNNCFNLSLFHSSLDSLGSNGFIGWCRCRVGCLGRG